LPDRRLPILYFAFGHLALIAAFGAVAFDPAAYSGFFYHPRMLAAVHLVTLGWISAWILGALHLVAPMALRTPLPARRIDYWIFGVYFLGATGVASHFWIDELSGVGWSGLMVTAAFLHVGARTARALRRAPIPPGVKLHFYFAFANAGVAALAGALLGFNRWHPFLPGFTLTHAYGHAHLAALGWATMMVFAAGYRLLPMILPAAMPEGWRVYPSAVLLEVGVLGLFVSFLTQSRFLGPSAVVACAGIAAVLARVLWMLRHPKPPPKGLPRPDPGALQALQALLYLALAALLGVYLAFSDTTEGSLRLAAVYGVFGLVGFLSQMVVGVAHRLLPLYVWLGAYAGSEYRRIPPSPHAMADRRLVAVTAAAWTLGVPLLAAGVYLQRVAVVGAAGWTLLVAAVAGAAGNAVVVRRLRDADRG
jgi:hypothetical protein